MDCVIDWFHHASTLSQFKPKPTMDGAFDWFHSVSTQLQFKPKPTVDPAINWGSKYFQSLQPTMDSAINWLVSQQDLLLRIARAVGVAVAAIIVVPLLWNVILGVVRMLWKVSSGVVSLPWKVISGGVRFVWKVIRSIFGSGGKGGKTMKAPGRNYRMLRSDFEQSPVNYFRNLRK